MSMTMTMTMMQDEYIVLIMMVTYMYCIRSQEQKLVPMASGDHSPVIVIANSNVKHSLGGSEYPVRVAQCKEAVRVLQAQYPDAPITELRDVSMDMLEEAKQALSDVCYRRAKHCIGEDCRTLGAVQALTEGDFDKTGQLMTQSHASLSQDYEVSSYFAS